MNLLKPIFTSLAGIIMLAVATPMAYSQEYILHGVDIGHRAEVAAIVDGVKLFVWNEENKEMAVMCDDLWLYPYYFCRVEPYDAREYMTGNTYSGDIVIPSHAEYNGETYTVTRIAFGAFINCPDLKSVTIPETIESIGPEAFYNCANLSHVEFPRDFYYVNVNIFAECPSLKKLDLKNISIVYPRDYNNGFDYIGGEFYFEDVYIDDYPPFNGSFFPFTRLYCRAETAPTWTMHQEKFTEDQYSNSMLIVPEGSYESYRSTEPWCNFVKIFESNDLSGIVNVAVSSSKSFCLTGNYIEATDRAIEIYSTLGVRIASAAPGQGVTLPAGIYIISDGTATCKAAVR